MIHRQRLHHKGATLPGSLEFQHPLVYGPGYGELEPGVLSEAHVGQILVRQHFQQHNRHIRTPALRILFIPEPPAGPFGIELRPEVPDDLGLDQIGQVTAGHPGSAVGEFSLICPGAVNSQGSDNGIAGSDPCIGMEGKSQIHRDLQSPDIPVLLRTVGFSHQVVYPLPSGHIIVIIIILSFVQVIDQGIGESGILKIVACSLPVA